MTAPQPTFLYVGMPKAASSWIFEILRQHPEIFVPLAKNIEFFDRNYHRGIDWYLNHFSAAGRARAIGELSHDYYSDDDACKRIHRHFPDARIICCLREPGDFLMSSYNYSRVYELDQDCDPLSYANSDVLKRYLRYEGNLRQFYDLFPAEQVKILFLDEIRAAPDQVIRELYRFLEVDEDFRPAFADRKVNAARQARSLTLTHWAFSTARLLRDLGFANLVGAVKRNRIVEAILYRPGSDLPSGLIETMSAIRDRYRPHYADLERLIGRPLPQSWYEAR